jgi:hypothetical protein
MSQCIALAQPRPCFHRLPLDHFSGVIVVDICAVTLTHSLGFLPDFFVNCNGSNALLRRRDTLGLQTNRTSQRGLARLALRANSREAVTAFSFALIVESAYLLE